MGRNRQGKQAPAGKKRFFDGVQTVRVNDIIACRFCTAKEFYFLVGNPFFDGASSPSKPAWKIDRQT